jgi:hypothetical protein
MREAVAIFASSHPHPGFMLRPSSNVRCDLAGAALSAPAGLHEARHLSRESWAAIHARNYAAHSVGNGCVIAISDKMAGLGVGISETANANVHNDLARPDEVARSALADNLPPA